MSYKIKVLKYRLKAIILSKNLTYKYYFFWYFEHDKIISWNAIYHQHPQIMNTKKSYFTFSFKESIILLLLSVSLNHAYGQSDPCDTGSENSCQCETADLL